MPSAEETTYLIEVMPDAGGRHHHHHHQDSFTSRDVDVLVSRIKENLRLSGCLKSRSSLAHKIRPSPYRLPSRSWSDPSTCELCSKNVESNDVLSQDSQQQQIQKHKHHQHHDHHHYYRRCRKAQIVRSELDDSYERFQALLRKGALIKEAVKRLQTCPEDEDEDDDVSSIVEEDDGGKTRRATSTSATSTTLDSMDDDEDDEDDEAMMRSTNSDDFFYRRKQFYYDSEDEPLPPCYQPVDL